MGGAGRGEATPARIAQRARDLKPAKKGEVRNPSGINGYTKARRRVMAALEKNSGELVAALIRIAKEGDATALKMALGPFVDAQKLTHEHTGTVVLRWEGEEGAPNSDPEEES